MKYRNPEEGQSPERGFDCSGFVRFVLSAAGLAVPSFIGQDGLERPTRHANEFWDSYGIPIHDEARQPGDLIFFSREGDRPTHIGILRDAETYI
ncbi:MAG TPA: NlpC/P60 family protein, partial [Candidatus Saccharimonadales bacterium]|nr:NlpC/P60 family protein [Candidatus Saccharimonadales bacterium]